MTALYQNSQIRDLESYVIKKNLSDEYSLMQKAGQAAFHALLQYWPQTRHLIVCCGKGNNGGDGYVLARLAKTHGLEVSIHSIFDVSMLNGIAKKVAEECKAAHVTIQAFDSTVLTQANVLVDALLGTGLHGEVQEPYLSAIHAINAANRPVMSIDVPSGIDVDNGCVHGTAVKAVVTITFIGLKQGLLTNKAPNYCGELLINDLEIPIQAYEKIKPSAETIEWKTIKPALPRRSRDAHKGDYGHVLVIGGDYGMGGAVRMAAEAALRVGSGLVTVATRPEHVPVVNSSRPEIMCHQVTQYEDLEKLIKRASIVVIGPGLGQSDWAKNLLNRVLESELPKVLDADALNLLSQLQVKSNYWILTPHPGEAARLLRIKCQAVQDDRFVAVDAIQRQYGGVAVLKGVGTLVKAANTLPKVCQAGNPGMASGGMGDVLSGIIGGLLAQRLDLAMAAEAGVLIHSLAADRAAMEGGERGLLATDLMKHIRALANPELKPGYKQG